MRESYNIRESHLTGNTVNYRYKSMVCGVESLLLKTVFHGQGVCIFIKI
ncbi:hypothetical protein [Bartonella harrusi]|uniref:Uncharacterized protein n=1 Tax=Bartonella harrusi TaxID=2961895 RepID=A0ABY5ES93_9HYPH|nr:hypothetical protein [Bartonella harrusi]UTO27960.1 hypothetical protein NMK50_06950 [Bartonella harrusi]